MKNPLLYVTFGIVITVLLVTEVPKIGGLFLVILLLLFIKQFEEWKGTAA